MAVETLYETLIHVLTVILFLNKAGPVLEADELQPPTNRNTSSEPWSKAVPANITQKEMVKPPRLAVFPELQNGTATDAKEPMGSVSLARDSVVPESNVQLPQPPHEAGT